MKSLIVFLFLGATVALAEIHVENDPNGDNRRGLSECTLKCFRGNPGKLAEEENDPRQPHRRLLEGLLKFIRCLSECNMENPSKSPPPPTEPGKVADVKV